MEYDFVDIQDTSVVESPPQYERGKTGLVKYLDETDDVYRRYADMFLKRDEDEVCDEISMVSGYGGVGLMPVEWILGWSTRSAKSLLFAKGLMEHRLSGLTNEERKKYQQGLIRFVTMMCELEHIELHWSVGRHLERCISLVSCRIDDSVDDWVSSGMEIVKEDASLLLYS